MTQVRAERWMYATEVLVFGLPALAVCPPMFLTLAVCFGTGEFAVSHLFKMLSLLVSSIVGIAAWVVQGITCSMESAPSPRWIMDGGLQC